MPIYKTHELERDGAFQRTKLPRTGIAGGSGSGTWPRIHVKELKIGVKEIARWERDFGSQEAPKWERSTGKTKESVVGNL